MNARLIQATTLCAVVAGSAACVADDGQDFGTTTAELSKADMRFMGATWCMPANFASATTDQELCTVCYTDYDCETTHVHCEQWLCSGGDEDECMELDHPNYDYCWQGPSYFYAVQFGFEAESVNRYDAMVVGGLASASNGGYVTVPTTGATASNLRYSFSLDSDAELYGWARVQVPAPVGPGDTWINLDGENTISVHLPYIGPNQWQWVPLADAVTGEHVPFVAAAGPHKFRMFTSPNGVRIDRVILTNARYYVPISDVYEAESMSIAGPMVKVVPNAQTLSNPGYIWVPNGAAAGGEASKIVYVPTADRYSIWGRVKAPTTSDNSFKVSTDYAQTTTWSMPVTGNEWKWHQVLTPPYTDPYLFDLTTNFNFYPQFEFFRDDDGTKLDKWIITNDLGFLPVDAPLVVGQP